MKLQAQVNCDKCVYGLIEGVFASINVESIAQLAISSSKIRGRDNVDDPRKKVSSRSTQIN